MTISTGAANAREQARMRDGKFGAQAQSAQEVDLVAGDDYTAMTPADVDTRLAEAQIAHLQAIRRIDGVMERVHWDVGDTASGFGKYRAWGLSDEDAEAALDPDSYLTGQLSEARDAAAEAQQVIEAGNAEFTRRGGWSRFFLVQNTGGHIHSTMSCSTCNKSVRRSSGPTRFAWLPELSGQNEEQAVAEHGAILCTVCFPSAPVHWTNAHEVAAAARKAAACPGSGTFLDPELPHRTGYYSGNWATCPACGEHISVTSTRKLRSHKPKA